MVRAAVSRLRMDSLFPWMGKIPGLGIFSVIIRDHAHLETQYLGVAKQNMSSYNVIVSNVRLQDL